MRISSCTLSIFQTKSRESDHGICRDDNNREVRSSSEAAGAVLIQLPLRKYWTFQTLPCIIIDVIRMRVYDWDIVFAECCRLGPEPCGRHKISLATALDTLVRVFIELSKVLVELLFGRTNRTRDRANFSDEATDGCDVEFVLVRLLKT